MFDKNLPPEKTTDLKKNKDIAAVSYIPLLGAMILFLRRESPFVQFHARQGLALFFCWIGLYIIPGIGGMLSLLALAGMGIGFINAAQGEYYRIFLIADLAEHGLKSKQILSILKKTFPYILIC